MELYPQWNYIRSATISAVQLYPKHTSLDSIPVPQPLRRDLRIRPDPSPADAPIVCYLSPSYVRRDSFERESWYLYVSSDSFTYVTWIILVWVIICSYVWHNSFMCVFWLVHVWFTWCSFVWGGCFVCIVWPICTLDITSSSHSHVLCAYMMDVLIRWAEASADVLIWW